MKKSCVLVSGGAGYIGSHTSVELINAGYDVVIVDNLSNSDMDAVEGVRRITGVDVPFEKADCCDRDAFARVFEKYDFDSVIHFAASKAVGESVQKPLAYYQNNLGCTLSLLKVMEEFGTKAFVFSSSATVYDTTRAKMPLCETAPLACTNPYGWTKLMGEQILQDVAVADPSMSLVLLRYFNPVGAHESGLIGEDPEGIPNNLMPYISQVAVGKREKLSIFGHDYATPDGTCIRDFIHVMDLAEGHVAAVAYVLGHRGTEVFNLGTGKGTSVLEMLHAFERANGLTVPHSIGARRPGDIAVCYADPSKSREILHWQAKRSVEEMCADSWRWQKQNPMGFED